MRWSSTRIVGVVEFTPSPHVDDRGFFSRTFDADVAREAGIDPDSFVQDSMSRSRRGVVRGLHVRLGEGESKLVRCSSGQVFDVVVDLRPNSPTHLEWLSVILDGEKQNSVFIPAGCAHGFQALTEPADTAYRIDRRHDPQEDLTIAHDDPRLAVPWPLPVHAMSRSDAAALPLAELSTELASIRSRARTGGKPVD
ncbi:dTDP-4-dehydrorhamnose 3,5-epimerase [Geodermatophilus pulveris]|uniref:dTDP-4-dehydrorhamnose 3,5-epimerase n=1 Tax=Geodermatophilus pulveris TaxID=1564159 RepID=A0A239J8H3_9ACTN|nr:dTDP-4-dehydrorhamnose 3,5-epimerase [Geodermatophilus pulveris]SNT02181.1 dTDP-4-dehydrorhamnose 3,5-epimerase [Geodermatophilus pulveris]